MAPNPENLKLVKEYSLPSIAFGIARVPDSSRAFISCSDFKVYAVDFEAPKWEPVELYTHESYATSLVMSDNVLVSGGYDGRLIWWDISKKVNIRSVDAHAKWIRKLAISPNGKQFASVADDMVCRVWDIESGKVIHELRGHRERTPTHFPSMFYAVTYSSDGKRIATGDKLGHIVIWDAETGKELASVEAPIMYTWDPVQRMHSIGGVRALGFSPDGKLLAAGGINKIGNIDHLEAMARVEVFDWQAKKQVAEFTLDRSKGIVNHLQFAPDGTWLLAAGGYADGFLGFLDVESKKVVRQEKIGLHAHQFALNAAGDSIWSAGHNKLAIHEMKA